MTMDVIIVAIDCWPTGEMWWIAVGMGRRKAATRIYEMEEEAS